MALARRLRRQVKQWTGRAVDTLRDRGREVLAPGGEPRELGFEARIPNPFADTPLFRLSLQLSTREHAQGEFLRLRAHVQTQLVLPVESGKAALPAPPATAGALLPRGRSVTRGLVERGLRSSLARRITPYLERRFETWLDLQADTSPLDQGARALVPEPLRALGIGNTPQWRTTTEPQIETWVGRCGGESPGVAQVTLLQFNEARGAVPPAREQGSPLHLAVSLATFYADKTAE